MIIDNFNFQDNNKAVSYQIIMVCLFYKEREPILSEAINYYINNLLAEDNKVACIHFLRGYIDQ